LETDEVFDEDKTVYLFYTAFRSYSVHQDIKPLSNL